MRAPRRHELEGRLTMSDLRFARMRFAPAPAIPVPDRFNRVHLIGIGGQGMSSIARILMARGVTVSGSDRSRNANTDVLGEAGAAITIGHAPFAQLGDLDAVLVTSMVPSDDPELAEARRRNLPVMHVSAALKALIGGSRLVTVAGTYDTTTASGMI